MLALASRLVVQTTTTVVEHAQQAPNPILPALDEIIWGSVSFLVLAVLMYKFAFPAVGKAMKARADKIRGDLESAEKVREEANGILEEYQRQLSDARNESNRIIEEARQAADQLRQDMIRRADEEVAELRRRSIEDLRSAQERVLSQLQSQVRTLAIELAEKVVAENLDRERNLALVDQFIAELNTSKSGGAH